MNLRDGARRRFGRRTLISLHPRRDRRLNEYGKCSVCGTQSTFVFNSWVVPNDQLADFHDAAISGAYLRRESLFCRSCGASLRSRRMADVVLSLYGRGLSSLSELVREERFRDLDVAEINEIGSLGSFHSVLRELPRLKYSQYQGSDRLGEVIDGKRNEDVCQLTYRDATFDLVLSSDTLEHVRDYRAALRETRRVLRTGGRHVFTVPVVASREQSRARVIEDLNRDVVYLFPPLYHGRGRGLYRFVPVGSDLLTFTDFGRDLTDDMRDAGFEPEVFRGVNDSDVTGALFVFSGKATG